MEEGNTQTQEKKVSKKCLISQCRKNPWMVSTAVLAIVVVLMMVSSLGMTGNVVGSSVDSEVVAQRLLSVYESQGVSGIELEKIVEESGLYRVDFKYQGQTVPVYVTLDGKMVGSLSAFPVEQKAATSTPSEEPVEVVKSDKPVVDLFVMTHCPYGTQAEKGFIPFMEAFGNNVDAKIRFVHYFMHGEKEETETPRQVCIREEQSEKFLPYLREFLVEGDAAAAEAAADIDSSALAECISSGRADAYYAEDSEISQAAGVRGSPTVVVNGAMAQAGRSPAAYLEVACSGFNTAPSECGSLNLDSASPAPMWGWDATGAATQAQC